MTTKEKIIESAIELFNRQGYGVVTLTELADHLEMSRGNLAYHFRDKELILEEIARNLQREIDEEMKKRRDFPAFSNLQVDIKSYHKLQLKYPFIFGNNSVLQHAAIHEVMNSWAAKTIQNNTEAFAFAVKEGNMQPEPFPGQYHNLAINTWIIIYFWLSQKNVRKDSSRDDAEKMVWSTILPHFTAKGIKAFEKHYGKNFVQTLGKPFEKVTQQLWAF